MTKRYGLATTGEITDNTKKLSDFEVIEKLNEYEERRKKKNREIEKFRKREDKYQQVVAGVMAFLELKLNNEIWWDWNE